MIFSRLSPLLNVPLVRNLTRDTLLRMDPEVAHAATINALRLGLAPEQIESDPPELRTTIAGLDLANPVGMAAGFDKNGDVPDALLGLDAQGQQARGDAGDLLAGLLPRHLLPGLALGHREAVGLVVRALGNALQELDGHVDRAVLDGFGVVDRRHARNLDHVGN